LWEGFVYYGAPFSWVSLGVEKESYSKNRVPIPVVCHFGSIHRRVSGGRFPIDKLTDACSWPVASLQYIHVVDMDSYNFTFSG
jgi:hypothetical protein